MKSQNTASSSFITVKVNIIGKVDSLIGGNKVRYAATSQIINQQDTIIKFWIMSGSWPEHNWTSADKKIYVQPTSVNFNYPILIELLPHKSINFNFILQMKSSDMPLKEDRLGFIFYDVSMDPTDYYSGKIKLENSNIFWSNSFELKNNFYTYYLE